MKTETKKYENFSIIQWAHENRGGKRFFWHATDLGDALIEIAENHSSDVVCDVYTKGEVKQHILGTCNWHMSECKILDIANNGPKSLDKDDIDCYNWCRVYEQMSNEQIYVEDEEMCPMGRFYPASEIDAMKYECLMDWLAHDGERGKICRELTEEEIAKIFSDEKNLPEHFSEYDRKDPEEEAERQEKLKELLDGARGNLYISEDDVIYAINGNDYSDDYAAIDENKFSDVVYSRPIVITEPVTA